MKSYQNPMGGVIKEAVRQSRGANTRGRTTQPTTPGIVVPVVPSTLSSGYFTIAVSFIGGADTIR